MSEQMQKILPPELFVRVASFLSQCKECARIPIALCKCKLLLCSDCATTTCGRCDKYICEACVEEGTWCDICENSLCAGCKDVQQCACCELMTCGKCSIPGFDYDGSIICQLCDRRMREEYLEYLYIQDEIEERLFERLKHEMELDLE